MRAPTIDVNPRATVLAHTHYRAAGRFSSIMNTVFPLHTLLAAVLALAPVAFSQSSSGASSGSTAPAPTGTVTSGFQPFPPGTAQTNPPVPANPDATTNPAAPSTIAPNPAAPIAPAPLPPGANPLTGATPITVPADTTAVSDPNNPANAQRDGMTTPGTGPGRPAAPRRPANAFPSGTGGNLPPRPAGTLPGQGNAVEVPADTPAATPGTPTVISGSASGAVVVPEGNSATGLSPTGSATGNLGISTNTASPAPSATGLSPTGGASGNLGIRPTGPGTNPALVPPQQPQRR